MHAGRVAVMGAGAVGGYFGAKLAVSGFDVAFIARGKHLEAMRRRGLKVESFQGDLSVRSLFTSEPEEVGPVDLILFCVKSYDTETAGRKLEPMLAKNTRILSLQNGVDNPDRIAALWGKERILAGVVYIGCFVSSPGMIAHRAGGRIILGELDGEAGEGAEAVCRLLNQAQIPCAISKEIRRLMWTKLVWNAPFCALACLARATAGEIVESASLREIALKCMDEVIDAARCEGIELGSAAVEDAMNLSRSIRDFKPSMLQDLEAGKPLEYQALNGIVADRLRRAGKGAPVNEAFYALLKFLDGKIRSGEMHR